ncbi:hypothetical protein PSSM2_116 [uncultured phage MedDCM-OCT-S04-C93]|nr:hypothetical protein PSSM2_116 [uncultured phage MedDCM-OCT-S04-C93]BAR36594.1 hypothetical protein [uncultured Mediterranean phage uvMED]|tara:strand:- start:492 stop:731 length:240 start_codon:yes stop_codon:yes gene_type:complete
MNKNYIKVKDHKNLYRDSSTNSIVNTDSGEYENYLKRRNANLKKTAEIDELKNEVNIIKNDLSEMKHLLEIFVKDQLNR